MVNKVTRAANRPQSFWKHHIRQWRKSGLSKAKYCRDQKLNAGTFYNWCSDETTMQSRKSGKASTAARIELLPVTLKGSAGASVGASPSSVSLEHSLGRFSFPPGLSAESIERWLQVIGRSHVQS